MNIELTKEQAVFLKLVLSVFIEQADTGVLKGIAKEMSDIAFKIKRGDF